MTTIIEYEQLSEEDYDVYVPDDERKPRRQKKVKPKAFTPTRCPYCYLPLKVYDTETPDEKIEDHIASKNCAWLEKNDPQVAHQIRMSVYARTNRPDDFKRNNRSENFKRKR